MPSPIANPNSASTTKEYKLTKILYESLVLVGMVARISKSVNTQWRARAPTGVAFEVSSASEALRPEVNHLGINDLLLAKNFVKGKIPSFAISCFTLAAVNVCTMMLPKLENAMKLFCILLALARPKILAKNMAATVSDLSWNCSASGTTII